MFKLSLLHLALLATVFECIFTSNYSHDESQRIDTRSSDNRRQDLNQPDERAVAAADLCNDGCCLRSLEIPITDALPGLRVEKPRMIDIGYCVVDSLVPCVGRSGRIYSRMLRFFHPELTHCMPIKYSEAPILYETLDTGEYSSAFLPETIVTRCGCA